MSFSEWTEANLEDVCEFQEGYVNPSQKKAEYFGEDIKWLRATDLNNGSVFDTSRKLSRLGFESAGKSALLFEPNTIVISKSGTIGRLGILKDYMCGNRATINIKTLKDKADYKYVFYFLLMNQAKIADMAVGSVQKNLYTSILGTVNLVLPPLQEQKAIAHILSTLDEKIEVNNRINKTLEEMAQAIFKHWFVDFEFPNEDGEPYKSSGGAMVDSELGPIPKGWEAVEIASICNIQNGFAFRATEYVDEGVKVIRTLNIGDDGFFNNDGIVFLPRTYENEKFTKYILEEFDIGLVMVGASIGKIGMVLKNTSGGLQNQNMWRFRSNSENVSQLFLYYVVKQAQEISKNWSTGSAREFYRKDSFSKIKVILPSNYIMERFHNIAKDFFNLISNNTSETQVLKSIRDTILPKLMSGEIRVPLDNKE